jgi:hypothetical protein
MRLDLEITVAGLLILASIWDARREEKKVPSILIIYIYY